MRVIGIDPGLVCTGVATVDKGKVETFPVKTRRTCSDAARQYHIVDSILRYVVPGDVLIFEDFAMSGKFQPSGKFVERIEIAGALKFVCQRKTGLPFLQCRPGHLKAFAAGKASAGKDEVRKAVCGELCRMPNKITTDEADALALAILGAHLVLGASMQIPITGGRRTAARKVFVSNKGAIQRIRFLFDAGTFSDENAN